MLSVSRALVVVMLVPLEFAFGQPGFSTLSSVHFLVKFQRGIPQQDAERVAAYLEQDLEYLDQKLGITLFQPLEVRIYASTGKFVQEIHHGKPWEKARYQRGVLHLSPVKQLSENNTLEKVLSYELVRALLDSSIINGCPRWLAESFAVYHSGLMTELQGPSTFRITSFADLNQDIQQATTSQRLEDVHFLLGKTMSYLIQQYGEERALGLFRAFDGKTQVHNVFQKHLDQDYVLIEEVWLIYLRENLPIQDKPGRD